MLDLRMPIGWFFIIIAVLLSFAGLLTPVPVIFGQMEINLDLVWGAVMGLFGIFMIALAYRLKMRQKLKTRP